MPRHIQVLLILTLKADLPLATRSVGQERQHRYTRPQALKKDVGSLLTWVTTGRSTITGTGRSTGTGTGTCVAHQVHERSDRKNSKAPSPHVMHSCAKIQTYDAQEAEQVPRCVCMSTYRDGAVNHDWNWPINGHRHLKRKRQVCKDNMSAHITRWGKQLGFRA